MAQAEGGEQRALIRVKQRKRGFSSSAMDAVRSVDYFGEPFSFKIDADKDKYSTCMGSLLSLIVLVTTLTFFGFKYKIYHARQGDAVSMIIKQDFLSEEHVINAESNFQLAAALVDYDGNTEPIDDPSYGELVIALYGWGYEGHGGTLTTDLKTHSCSDEELGLAGSDFLLADTLVKDVRTKQKSFKCYDPNDVDIWGDYNSGKAQQLVVQFRICKSEDPEFCKSPQ